MRIKKLELLTDSLDQQKSFYADTLGLDIIGSSDVQFSVCVGWSQFVFRQSEVSHHYHYCFLIPSNQLQEAQEWVSNRVDLIEIESGRYTQWFENWNAESFYFCDPSGNIAECIVRYDLQNESDKTFDQSSLLCVNEIGLPTNDIAKTSTMIQEKVGSTFWKGDQSRFGTNGNEEGVFLLPNYNVKDTWFPTKTTVECSPFVATIEQDGKEVLVDISKDQLNRWCRF